MNKINLQNKNISFTSRNHPIKPQIFHSAKGDIIIREAVEKDLPVLSKFTWDTAILAHSDLAYLGDPRNIDDYKDAIKDSTKKYKDILNQKDGNSTVLVAQTSDNTIIGTGSLKRLEFPKGLKKVGEFEDFYIDEKFRGVGLGKKFGQLLIDSVKKFYTDILLSSATESNDFYRKLGFEEEKYKPQTLKLAEKIKNDRDDADYITIMSMNLSPKNSLEKRLHRTEKRNAKKDANK